MIFLVLIYARAVVTMKNFEPDILNLGRKLIYLTGTSICKTRSVAISYTVQDQVSVTPSKISELFLNTKFLEAKTFTVI